VQMRFWKLLLLLSVPYLLSFAQAVPNYPGGKTIDKDGRKFYVDCFGSGFPTVLLWSGQGGGFLDWLLVQPEIAKTNRVCSFDPAGFGRSDPTPDSDTFEGNVRTLTEALQRAGESGPFVLVGQSYGGIDVRLFQHQYPQLVRGMVLIDSYEIAAPWKGQMVPLYELTAGQLRSTLPDHSHAPRPTVPTEIEEPFKKLPPAAQQEHLDDVRRMVAGLDFRKEPAVMESFRSTMLTLHNAAMKADSLHGLPLFILTRDGVSPAEEKIQASYLRLSIHSHRQIAKGCGHFIQLDNPKVVIDSIRQVIAGTHSPK
jgi:pimeloyl-ACP methyl ester carboxylesterase